ncbi:MAG: endonuclease MutS2 [Anaerolineales bacterium]|nr:endonuclease MutS2 [Anaerolineales bacterium]
MDAKSQYTLEFQKILERLAAFTAFSASNELARSLKPTNRFAFAVERQARTTEARRLLSENETITIGGAHDVRQAAERAARGGVLPAEDLLDIRDTLVSGRDLQRYFEKMELELPNLKSIAARLTPPPGVIEAIGQVFSDDGEIRDDASPRLAVVRATVKKAHDRVISRLQDMISNQSTARMLQEAIITMRGGRYVVPIRAEYKSRMKCVVQDQSASGATLFVEPLAVVELNNTWLESILAEKEEVQRILAALSVLVGEQRAPIQTVVRALADMDLALACAKYADAIRAAEPVLKEFDSAGVPPDPLIKFIHARHPLLDPETVVPIDLMLEKGTLALVITGPNTGGKTVTLKTAGLLVLMAQAGLHIPAESGSEMILFGDVYADIGDEQSIEQSLSTFSAHITNIVRILKKIRPDTLVLLDELGAGTDPQEGSALARALLTYLLRRATPSLVATHYPELKAFAQATDGATNASVEFDLDTLQPTFRLITGLPGRSNALEIASRLGIKEAIISDARGMIHPDELQTDDLLDEIHRQLEEARRERVRAESFREEAENIRMELQERLDAIGEERVAVLEAAREEAQRELEDLQAQIENLRKKSDSKPKTLAEKKTLRKQARSIEKDLKEPVRRKKTGQTARPLRIGDRVHVRSLDSDGTVEEIGDEDAMLRIGKMRVRTPLHQIERPKGALAKTAVEAEESEKGRTLQGEIFRPSPGVELHLLGMRAEDALLGLERYLDEAFSAGLPFSRIIHGKGTGTLRDVVRQVLDASPLVIRWEEAQQSEGGEGVTIAHCESH